MKFIYRLQNLMKFRKKCHLSMFYGASRGLLGEIQVLHEITYDDVIKWNYFPRYWPFVQWIHRSPVNSPHKGQWRETLMFSLICVWINGWVNNRDAGDLRLYHYDVLVMVGRGVARDYMHMVPSNNEMFSAVLYEISSFSWIYSFMYSDSLWRG